MMAIYGPDGKGVAGGTNADTTPTDAAKRAYEEIAYAVHDDVCLALGYPLGPKAEDALIESVVRHLKAAVAEAVAQDHETLWKMRSLVAHVPLPRAGREVDTMTEPEGVERIRRERERDTEIARLQEERQNLIAVKVMLSDALRIARNALTARLREVERERDALRDALSRRNQGTDAT